MASGAVHADVDEKAKHVSAIQTLSQQYRLPTDTVAELYEHELASISQDALITTYLPIFVTRRVNEMLRRLYASSMPARGDHSAGFVR
jgi:hypothetical protein